MIEDILAMVGVTSAPTIAGIKAFLNLRDRIASTESKQTSNHEIITVKLDAIAEKIDLRCDALEQRINRVERSMNGYLKHDV